MKNIEEYCPVGEMILVRVDMVEEKTESGLLVKAEITKDREQILETRGVIVKVGKNAWEEYSDNPWAKVGDKVVFRRNAGEMHKNDDGSVYRIMNCENVLAVYPK